VVLTYWRRLFSHSHFLCFLFLLPLYPADLDEGFGFDLGFFEHHLVVKLTHHLHFFGRGLGAFRFGFLFILAA